MDSLQNILGSESNKENWPPNSTLDQHPPVVGQAVVSRPPASGLEKENSHLHTPTNGPLSRPSFTAANPGHVLYGANHYQIGLDTFTGPIGTEQQSYQPQRQQYGPYQPSVHSYSGMSAYPVDPFQRPGAYQPVMPNPAVPSIDPALNWTPDKVMISATELEEIRRTIAQFQEMKNAQSNQQRQNDESQLAINQTVKEFQDLQAAMQANVAKEKHRKERNNPLIAAVHLAMQDLLPVVMVENQNGEIVEATSKLPEPLPDGSAPNKAPDGTRLYNPRWLQGITQDAENNAYRKACVALIQSREVAKADSEIEPLILQDKKALLRAVDKYFNTLRARYKITYSVDAAEKFAATAQSVKLRARKKQLAKVARQGIQPFRKQYGAEATENIESIIHTDWMPSEHSDSGNMDPTSFSTHRSSHIGVNKGWEVRDLLWRSKRLVRFYLRLVELYHEELAEKARCTGKKRKVPTQTPTFPCLPENANNNPPALISETKAMPYRWCVSKAWANRTDNQALELEEDPDFAIFKLVIPDADLSSKALAELAKYEN